ncbi:hypothetical protein [Streptomyces sp. PR69]|nr:hypothetical protein [Streptomyces sp. PR69]
MPEDSGNRQDEPPREPRWQKLRKSASVIAAVSAAVYNLGRLVLWLRKWT